MSDLDTPTAPGRRASSPAPAPIRIAVVNDYHVVVAGIAALLEPYGDRVEVVELAVNAAVTSDVDIVLYDTFALTQGTAIPWADLRPSSSSARLVVFTWHLGAGVVGQTRDVGAAGLVSKSASAEELLEAIERVHRGELVFPASGIDEDEVRIGRWPGKEHGLTARESEVLALICQGLSNQAIADRAFLGLNTVKTYIRTTYRKIDVASRSQAVIWGLEHSFEPDRLRVQLSGRDR